MNRTKINKIIDFLIANIRDLISGKTKSENIEIFITHMNKFKLYPIQKFKQTPLKVDIDWNLFSKKIEKDDDILEKFYRYMLWVINKKRFRYESHIFDVFKNVVHRVIVDYYGKYI